MLSPIQFPDFQANAWQILSLDKLFEIYSEPENTVWYKQNNLQGMEVDLFIQKLFPYKYLLIDVSNSNFNEWLAEICRVPKI